MKILAISGSGRQASTNTAMLKAMAGMAPPQHQVTLFHGVADLPVFSPDLEGRGLPEKVSDFTDLVRDCDGIIIASPEYVRAIPGGLKNAIDWLVSRDEIIGKPIAILHGSHRGDDMLAQLRLVLSTVSDRFSNDIFLRFELLNLAPHDIAHELRAPENQHRITAFLQDFTKHCGG